MAAPIITCPACAKKFKGKEGLVGKRIKCPLCTTPFLLTEEQVKVGAAGQAKADKAPIKMQADSSKGARVTWNKEDEDSTGYQLGEFDLRARCPNCANLMESEEAIVCLFCGYNLQTRTWGATVRTTSITGGQHFVYLLPGMIFLLLLIAFMVGLLIFCLDLPYWVANTWASFLDHESVRMWIIGLMMAFMFVFGWLSVKRLVLHPKPAEKLKESNARNI